MKKKHRTKKTYLDELVPAGGDNDGVLGVGAEANAGNPLGVALVGDGVLAVTEGVPQLDGAVTGSGDDLAVVGGERDGEDVAVVADEAAGGGAAGELPQAEGLVPRGGQSVGTVGGDNLYKKKSSISAKPVPCKFPSSAFDIGFGATVSSSQWDGTYAVGDDVRVTVERALGVSVLGLVAGQVPDDEGLVARSRQEHVGAARKVQSQQFSPLSTRRSSSQGFSSVRVLVVKTYFSIEVAKLVTQPF